MISTPVPRLGLQLFMHVESHVDVSNVESKRDADRLAPASGMGRSVLKRVEALIKREGYGAQKTIAKMSGVAQPILCQWLRGRCAAAAPSLSPTAPDTHTHTAPPVSAHQHRVPGNPRPGMRAIRRRSRAHWTSFWRSWPRVASVCLRQGSLGAGKTPRCKKTRQ